MLLRAIEWWYHDPNVSTPVLKLMAELVQNRSQRLHFDVSSPNGILLFRVTSEMIVAYGMADIRNESSSVFIANVAMLMPFALLYGFAIINPGLR